MSSGRDRDGSPAILAEADVVICAASLGVPLRFCWAAIAPHALVCDAGYPKNLSQELRCLAPQSSWRSWDRSLAG